MQDVQQLFQFILKHERTIVFGNLGRKCNVLFETLTSFFPSLDTIVVSNHYSFPVSNSGIRVFHSNDLINRCDLLIFIEPASLQLIDKHPMTSHVVIFTSHFTFNTNKNSWWNYVCYFHSPSIEDLAFRTQNLLKLQDASIQTRNAEIVKFGDLHVNALIFKGHTTPAPTTNNNHIIIDLTKDNKDTLSMYLKFWDGFDYLLEYSSFVNKWVICFSTPNGHQAFLRFTQKCIDTLFCKKFEHGNVIKLQQILSLIPFYNSGTIDRNFNVRTLSFGGIKFVIPNTIEEACKAAAKFDTIPVTKNILRIVEK